VIFEVLKMVDKNITVFSVVNIACYFSALKIDAGLSTLMPFF
jgi:hypothetical protein